MESDMLQSIGIGTVLLALFIAWVAMVAYVIAEDEGSEAEAEDEATEEDSNTIPESTSNPIRPSVPQASTASLLDEAAIAALVEARIRERERVESKRKARDEMIRRIELEPPEADCTKSYFPETMRHRVNVIFSSIEKPWLDEQIGPNKEWTSHFEKDWEVRGYALWKVLGRWASEISYHPVSFRTRLNEHIRNPQLPKHRTTTTRVQPYAVPTLDRNYAKFQFDQGDHIPASMWDEDTAHLLFEANRIPLTKVLLRYRTVAFCIEHLTTGRMFLWDVPVEHRTKDVCVLALKSKLGGLADVPPELQTTPEFVNACTQENVVF